MPLEFRTIIEPFRIKSVEPIRFTTRDQREAALRGAGYNLFTHGAGWPGGRVPSAPTVKTLHGYRIVEQGPWLRHFTARFEPWN